ncbi:MAG TPA: helix-turn-helix transcriptional regulator [Candidatus Saccharimonadales bacterium]|nr:helix-turn-helix transcriptional regulator [Candidatus Saccharimonadales bacterium]
MSEDRQELPFKHLGNRLKTIRQKLHESVAEVSGAVEIDVQKLERIEQGCERPSEDILLLLINHFGMQDDDAANLWQLAGYDQPHDRHDGREDQQTRTMVMIMAVDPRIIYSDGAQVHANTQGVTINFMQGVGTPQSLTTARIGMSREQAWGLLHTLEHVLEGTKPRELPQGEGKPKENSDKSNSPSDKSKGKA